MVTKRVYAFQSKRSSILLDLAEECPWALYTLSYIGDARPHRSAWCKSVAAGGMNRENMLIIR